ncbi:MAG: EAL domain-containing protein [Burkholderiales bacterium]|nr:EAL domain-containing protein [Burkholderiales bacterium]
MNPFRLWQKLSLAARVMAVAGAVLAITSIAYCTVALKTEIEYHRADLEQNLKYELDFLAPAIAEPVLVGDFANVQQMLAARVQQPDIAKIAWIDNDGTAIHNLSDEAALAAPVWFAHLADLPDLRQAKPITVGGENYGKVEVTMSTVPSVNKIWQIIRTKLGILLIGMGTLFALIVAIVSSGLRPLYDLKAAALRFGQGAHALRIPPSGPPEMQASIEAFNNMAGNIELLLASLQDSGARNRLLAIIVEQSNLPIITKDLQGLITSWNPAATALYGYAVEEMLGKPISMLHVEGSNEIEETLQRVNAARATIFEAKRVGKDGIILDVSISVSPLYDENNRHIGEVGITRDITRQKRAEAALSKEKERAQVTLASIADAVVTTDINGNIDYLNPVAEKLLGWFSEEAYGYSLTSVFHCINDATGEPIGNPVAKVLSDQRTLEVRGDALLVSRNGVRIPIEHSAAPITDHDDHIIGVVLVFRDVSASHNMARQLSWQASHDALTALVNRREFERRLASLIDSADSQDRKHALLYMDLDQFKVVNDTCGHGAGDELLRQLSALLNSRIRGSDIIARLGGDEFGVLLADCPIEKAMEVGETLRQAVSDFRFVWQDKTFAIGVSIGVVAITGKREDNADVMAVADAACYAAKDKGRNQVQASPNARELSQRRGEMLWVSRINSAFEENRFRIYYQRIVPIQSAEEELHYEVLLRMLDQEGNVVPPMMFIPAAERYNLMRALDRKVICMAFEECAMREANGWAGDALTISINLSGDTLSDALFLDFLKTQFETFQVDPREICFEVTETAAIANLSQAANLIKELREMGCRFSLDDFGSGLSSFGYLKNLPVDYLKIDGGFVKDMVQDEIDTAMVNAIHNIGHVMGIKTIAEWVENQETLDALKRIGIDYAQGYFFDRPKPLAELMPAAKEIMAGF